MLYDGNGFDKMSSWTALHDIKRWRQHFKLYIFKENIFEFYLEDLRVIEDDARLRKYSTLQQKLVCSATLMLECIFV